MDEEGLLPQLISGLQLFYAGLDALGDSARGGGGGSELPGRELVVDGIPVTVVDRVGLPGTPGSSGPSAAAPAFEMAGGSGGELVRGNVRLTVVPAEGAPGPGGGGLQFMDEALPGAAAAAAQQQQKREGAGAAGDAGEGSLHEDGPLPVIVEEPEEGPEAFLAP
jgi:hypothetical protein